MKFLIIVLILLLLPIPLLADQKVLCNYTEESILSPDGFTRYNLICSGDIIINKGNQTKFYMKYGKAIFDQSNSDGQIVPNVSGYVEPIYITRRKEKVIKLRLPTPDVLTICPVNVKVKMVLPDEKVVEDPPDDVLEVKIPPIKESDDAEYFIIQSGITGKDIKIKRHGF